MTSAARLTGKAALARLLENSAGRVLVFDLDDTVLLTARRHLRILREYSARRGLHALAEIDAGGTRYRITDTARSAGVVDPAVLDELREFWFQRFFTNEYLGEDEPVPGAAQFCRQARASSARVAYLTGRDESMRAGTLASLKRHAFPLPGEDGTELLLKPRFDIPDEEYKSGAIEALRALGEVAGSFENEPAHANLLARSFPSASTFLVETRHSGRPVEPLAEVHRISDFLL